MTINASTGDNPIHTFIQISTASIYYMKYTLNSQLEIITYEDKRTLIFLEFPAIPAARLFYEANGIISKVAISYLPT